MAEFPSWVEYLDYVDENVTNHKNIVSVPALPDNLQDVIPFIENDTQWDILAGVHETLGLIKLHILDATDFYDTKPPIYSPVTYKTKVKYSDEERWCPFSEFKVSQGGAVELGNSAIHGASLDELHLAWNSEHNQCAADIIFSNSDKKSFTGTLFYPKGENVAIQGEQI